MEFLERTFERQSLVKVRLSRICHGGRLTGRAAHWTLPQRRPEVAQGLAVGDLQRFDKFADFIVQTFPAPRIWDVAGGMGKLNQALTARGRHCVTFDVRPKHLPVPFAERLLLPDEPCEADLLVGLHPDGATRVIVDYAAAHGLPFAVVPCCSDNSMPYRPWVRHIAELGVAAGFAVEQVDLAISGRRRVVVGRPQGLAKSS